MRLSEQMMRRRAEPDPATLGTVSIGGEDGAVVTDGEKTYLVNRGCAGMATAGSGDVLSGIIVGTVAQNPYNLLLSVAYATFINGLAGEMAQREKTDICMTSADTVTKIPEAVIYCRDASK